MDNMRALINFAILNANRRSGKNYLDSLMPFVEELFIRRGYEEVNIDRICTDFYNEFAFRIPHYPMKVVLKKLVREKKLDYCSNNIWKKIAMYEKAIIATRKEYESMYKKVLQEFINFVKTSRNEDLTEQIANDTLIAFMEKQDANLLFFAKKDLILFPEVKFERKHIKYLSTFLQAESKKNSNIFKYVVEIASGHMLASTIINEEKQLHEEKVQKVRIYCDTTHVLRLLGLSGDIPKRMVEDLFRVFVDSKCQLVLFKHTYNEILHNISNAKRWFKDPNCDMIMASRTTLYFIENNFTELDVDRVLNSIDSQLKEFNIQIEDGSYSKNEHTGQIDSAKLRGYIESEYKARDEEFDAIVRSFLLDNDVRSIEMVYRKIRGNFPQRFKDLRIVFMCANSSLAKACKNYHLEIEEPRRDGFIPICVTDIFLGTYMWLQFPQEIDKLAKGKIIAEAYSILQPSDSMIRRYLAEVQNYYKRREITEDDYLLLRAFSVINELLPECAETVEQVTHNTPNEVLEKIKSQSREEGLRKYYEEKEERKRIQEELNREREARIEKRIRKKKTISDAVSFIIDLIVALIIFLIVFLATFIFNINNIFIKVFAALVLGSVGSWTFWGLARGHSFYEKTKRLFGSPITEYIFEKFWGDL